MLGKIKEFFKNNIRIAVLVLFVLEFLINIWIVPNQYDGEFFLEKMEQMSLFDFLLGRYQNWTSRLLLELVTCVILSKPSFVWILLNTIMTTIIGYSILKIFVKKEDRESVWMAIGFILIAPIYKVSISGWGVGTIVYTWPLAMLLFSCIPIKKIVQGQKIQKWMYPMYCGALLFACNQEQSCMIAFGIYGLFTILEILKNRKKVHPFLVVQWGIVILSLIFIATCPGNYVRKNAEIQNYYSEFGMLGILDKISLGLTATVNNLLVKPNLAFLVCCLLIAVYIFKVDKTKLHRAICMIPLIAIFVFGILKNAVCSLYPYLNVFYEIISLEEPMLNATNYMDGLHFIPLMMAFIILGSLFLSILLIFKKLENNIAIVLYILGLLSRVAMGFSPTIFGSTDRTFVFFEFALIIISILIWQEFLKQTDKTQIKARNRVGTVIIILAVLQYFQTFIYTLVSRM